MAGPTRTAVRWSADDGPDEPGRWLDDGERVRWHDVRRAADRSTYLVSRILLKSLVGELADVEPRTVRLSYRCPDCGRAHGRPVVVGPESATGWQVSLAHATPYVVVGASDAGPLGVDVERTDAARFAGFDAVALTPGEREHVQRLTETDPGAAEVWRALTWVRKEAVLKASGHGLRVDPATVDLGQLGGSVQVVDLTLEPPWVGAVAVLTDQPVGLEAGRVRL